MKAIEDIRCWARCDDGAGRDDGAVASIFAGENRDDRCGVRSSNVVDEGVVGVDEGVL